MKNTLIIYEHSAALYDVYHWIERFKDKIKKLDKYYINDQEAFNIQMDYEENIYIISFQTISSFIHFSKYDKMVIIGRVPVENKEIMLHLQNLFNMK